MLSLLIVGSNLEKRGQEALNLHPNSTYILDGRQEGISIEDVRLFQKSLSLANVESTTRHAFILEAQKLSLPAQQALLKVLEEPPPNTQFVLTTQKTTDLPATIVSRCQVKKLSADSFELDQAASDQAKNLLKQITLSDHGKLISISENLAKNKEELNILLLLLKQSLHTNPTAKRSSAIKAILTCINDLKSNIQPQLAVEHLLFSLKALT